MHKTKRYAEMRTVKKTLRYELWQKVWVVRLQ